jgi:hypothetical protein
LIQVEETDANIGTYTGTKFKIKWDQCKLKLRHNLTDFGFCIYG